MNNAPGQSISSETRAKVQHAAGLLGYVPHPIARALREGVSRIVVLDVGGLPRTPVLDTFIQGLDEELASAGYGLFVTFGIPGYESTAAAVAAINPRAVIDLAAIYANPRAGVPDGGWRDGMASHYLTQVTYLHDRGHRDIAIAVPAGADDLHLLMADLVRAAAQRIGMSEPVLLPVGADGSRTVMERLGGATAIAALTDALAFEVLGALHDEEVDVPGAVAVIGWGDSEEAALWRPTLTSIRIDARTYGRRMAREILNMPIGNASPAPTTIVTRQSA